MKCRPAYPRGTRGATDRGAGVWLSVMANGRREPAGPQHSWNTDTPLCNLLVLNVQRQSHHHEAPMLPYQYLKDLPDAPRLPTPYKKFL